MDTNLYSIGRNIRTCRVQRKMRQEDLADKTDLSVNYIGMIERGEKIPALDTFIKIVNCLEASADVLLADVTINGYQVKNSLLAEKINKLTPADQAKIYDVIDTMVRHSSQIRP